MTIQNIVEEIHQVFPKIGESQIIFDLDKAQKTFIDDTYYLEATASLVSPNSYSAWALPSDFSKLKEVLLYDIDGLPLYIQDYQLVYEIEFGNIYFRSTTDTPISVIPTGIAFIYLAYYHKPTPLLTVTDLFSVEDEHVAGIAAMVYTEYYSRFPVDIMISRGITAGEIIHTRDFNAVKYWEGKAQEYRVKAKKWVNKKNDTSTGSAINYGMAGDFSLTKRIIGTTSTTLQPITSIYSKYVQFVITPTSVTQNGGLYGFASVVPVLNLATNTVTFTGDFSVLTWFTSNNTDYNIITANNTTITVQWSVISGTIDVILFER
ncbi:MAG: hypothetical protein ACYDBX_04975 [Patescibacteria group bacterium]